MDDFLIIENQLDEMSEVMNASVGERFGFKGIDTILIVQRRMKECDLCEALREYNEIFAGTEISDLSRITKSVCAYIKVKVLVDAKMYDFNSELRRILYREYEIFHTKFKNIIQLTKVNEKTAEGYKKENIALSLSKNEAIKSSIEAEMKRLDVLIEADGALCKDGAQDNKTEVLQVEETKYDKATFSYAGLSKVSGVFLARKNQKEMEDKLKEMQKDKSQTLCKEIPFYEKRLNFDESILCKDMRAYSLVRKKNNLYFGLTKNISGKSYDNSDGTMVELTEADENFIQYMTEDLLGGEYNLKPFTKNEKSSLRMYFSFVTNCFEREIGQTLTVAEYLAFKTYYNRIVLCMFELDESFRDEYYRALILADNYLSYMNCYDLEVSDEKKQIIQNIMAERNRNYISDLQMIIENHVVDKKARETIDRLIDRIKRFQLSKCESKDKNREMVGTSVEPGVSMISGILDPTPESLDPAIHFRADEYNDEESLGIDDFRLIQIKIQFLNSDYVIIDEALFATNNVKQAVYDYLRKSAYIKKIGLYVNQKEIFLYSSKNGSLSVPVLDENMRGKKRLDEGVQGQLVKFYEEQIKQTMIELTG